MEFQENRALTGFLELFDVVVRKRNYFWLESSHFHANPHGNTKEISIHEKSNKSSHNDLFQYPVTPLPVETRRLSLNFINDYCLM